MKAGDIVRFKKYYLQGGKSCPVIRRNEVMWGIAIAVDGFLIIGGLTTPAVLERIDKKLSLGGRRKELFIYPNDDVYEVVPPEKWPEEICVYMAKRVLLGEEE